MRAMPAETKSTRDSRALDAATSARTAALRCTRAATASLTTRRRATAAASRKRSLPATRTRRTTAISSSSAKARRAPRKRTRGRRRWPPSTRSSRSRLLRLRRDPLEIRAVPGLDRNRQHLRHLVGMDLEDAELEPLKVLCPRLEEQHHLVLVLHLPLPFVDAAHGRKDVAARNQSWTGCVRQ